MAGPAQVLMWAQVRGNSQGLIKIPTGGLTRAASQSAMTVDKETSVSALVNGHSDFFREEFIRWLSGYVLRIQLKRLAHNPKLQEIGSTPSAD